jgi:hypothetical protein
MQERDSNRHGGPEPADNPHMSYTLFVSHSVAWGDELLIAQLCGQVRKREIACHVARRNWKFGPSVIVELEETIAAADGVLAIVMNDGTAASYVNQELGIARRLGKPVIALVEETAHPSPLLEKVPDLVLVNPDAPDECAITLFSRLATFEADRRVRVALSWLILGTLGWIFMGRD